MRRALALAAGLMLAGCATQPVVYGPIGQTTPFGYRDYPNPDGGHTLLVVMPGMANPQEVWAFWERRAGELCPAGTAKRNVFRAERKDTIVLPTSNSANVAQRVWASYQMEGYVYCNPTADKPAA